MKNIERPSEILFMGTFPPRECGIATFTKDLTTAIDNRFSPLIKSKILAMNNDVTNIYNYPKNVILQINDTDIQEYIDMAKTINKTNNIKLVNIQHEFGIFGGEYGNYLVPFLELLKKPVVITFHSVLPNPNKKLKKIVQCIADKTTCFIVMTNKAIDILRNDYEINTDIIVIPHGIPTVQFQQSIKEKTRLGYKDRIILSSFGMINPGKGYEYVIDALPEVIKKFPKVLYLIIGETHPVVRKKEGESYRNFLEDKVKALHLEKNVKFYNKYLKLSEIVKYLKATDIYISSSLNPKQITSGTLAYAMGCGRAVISTPFLHARDAVSSERGILVEFENPDSFANAIIRLLSNPGLKQTMEKNAYNATRNMTWPNVALAYRNLFDKYVKLSGIEEKALPKIKLTHLMKLTDSFGVMQFANGSSPDKAMGYTLDDNARAMIASAMYYNLFNDKSKLDLIKKYLDFITFAQLEDGKIYNFVNYSRKINRDHWSDDAHGRAIWALGYLISIDSIPEEIKNKAKLAFKKALNIVKNITSPRSVSFIISGLYFYNKTNPSSENIALIRELTEHLVSIYNDQSCDNWQWFEEYLTYSNSKLPEALFYSYLATQDEKYLRIAISSLDFLSSITFKDGIFAPIGHRGWYFKNGKRAYFDQQPVDTSTMVQTLILAAEVTKQEEYIEKANSAFHWFLGKNSINQIIYDESTGGCYDGLGKFSINLNQGAESTISYLIARLCLEGNYKLNN
ncbi:glycosyltransferase [Candidatus Woesearchaeota archaeon]|nr:glycosyltransferase [Candidatus Woesearchaeota archaeon]